MKRRRRSGQFSRELLSEESGDDIDPCSLEEISNDAPTCNLPRFYGSCISEARDMPTNIVTATVLFDYEIYFLGTTAPLEALEGLLLEHLAYALELDGCTRNLQGDRAPQVRAISADPKDETEADGALLYWLL